MGRTDQIYCEEINNITIGTKWWHYHTHYPPIGMDTKPPIKGTPDSSLSYLSNHQCLGSRTSAVDIDSIERALRRGSLASVSEGGSQVRRVQRGHGRLLSKPTPVPTGG